MFENEKQFEKLVKKLNFDDAIDPSHKERLRSRVIEGHKAKSRLGLTKIILSIAASVLIGFVIGRVVFYAPQPGMVSREVASFDYAQDKPVQKNNDQIQYAKVDADNVKDIPAAYETATQVTAVKVDEPITVESENIIEIQKAKISETLQSIRTPAEANDTNNPFNKAFAEPNMPPKPSTLIICIDKKTNEPIADANVRITLDNENIAGITDVNGIYKTTIPPEENRKFLLTIEADDYSRMRLTEYRKEMFFEMSWAIEVGGTVTDSQGNPVEGANVRVRANTGQMGKGLPFIDIDNENLATDANGFWFCDFFPEDANEAGLSVKHPDFLFYDGFYDVNVSQLENFSHVMVPEK